MDFCVDFSNPPKDDTVCIFKNPEFDGLETVVQVLGRKMSRYYVNVKQLIPKIEEEYPRTVHISNLTEIKNVKPEDCTQETFQEFKDVFLSVSN